MRTTLLAPLPAAIVLLLTLVAMMPWGGPDWLEMALALMTVGAIYFWSLRRPRLLPGVVVFGLGLMLDAMIQGPLGVWASAALVAAMTGRLVRQSPMPVRWLRGTVYVMATLAIAAFLVATVTSLHDWRIVAPRVVAEAYLVACLAYPALAGVLSLIDGLWPVVDGRSLFLRGD